MKWDWKSGIITVLMLLMIGVGLRLGDYLLGSSQPIHATATDRLDNRIMATGNIMDGLEAVYLLEQNTGRLTAGILQRESQAFQGLYETNVNTELAKILQMAQTEGQNPVIMPQNPKFTMVTGQLSVPRTSGTGWQVPQSVLYVHELNTGYVMVFIVPWVQEEWRGGQSRTGPLVLWSYQQFCRPVQ